MALQLNPTGIHPCGYCSFSTSDESILITHLIEDHCGFSEKHQHVLWCGLCRPSLHADDGNDGQQPVYTNEEHSDNEIQCQDENDISFGDWGYYYPEYNGLYYPYTLPNMCYYPMNPAHGRPYYRCLYNSYYQDYNVDYFSDDFYDGTDITHSVDGNEFIDPININFAVLDVPPNSVNIQNANSCLISPPSYMTPHTNVTNAVKNTSDGKTHPTDMNGVTQAKSEMNNKSSYPEIPVGKLETSLENIVNADSSSVLVLNMGPLPKLTDTENICVENFSNDKTRLVNINGNTRVKKVMNNPKHPVDKLDKSSENTQNVDRSSVFPKNNMSVSYLEPLSKITGTETINVEKTTGVKTRSIDINGDIQANNGLNKKSLSKQPICKLDAASETILNEDSSSVLSNNFMPVSNLEPLLKVTRTARVKNTKDIHPINMKDDTQVKNSLDKEYHYPEQPISKLDTSSENTLNGDSITVLSKNLMSVSNLEPQTKVADTEAVRIKISSDVKTLSIDINSDTLAKKEFHHPKHPNGKLEASPENILEDSTSALPVAVMSLSDVGSPRTVDTDTVRIEYASDIATRSVSRKSNLQVKNHLNETHLDHLKPEALLNIMNANSSLALPKNAVPISGVKPLPKVAEVETVRKEYVSDVEVHSISMNGDLRAKKAVNKENHYPERRNSKREATSPEFNYHRKNVKNRTHEDMLNQGSLRNCQNSNLRAGTGNPGNCRRDKTGTPLNVGNTYSCLRDPNSTHKNSSGSVSSQGQNKLTYSEVVKRGIGHLH